MQQRILYLSWESPWPAQGGGSLRRWGQLGELSKQFEVHLLVLSRKPLSSAQRQTLGRYAETVTRIPLQDMGHANKVRIASIMAMRLLPYHCAVLLHSFRDHVDALEQILTFPGVVYASGGSWGTLAVHRRQPNWILDQLDADVDFWRVYATQATSAFARLAALLNMRLADRHFRRVYRQVGRIVSVCEEDRQLTLALAPGSDIQVIPNGVDCSHYVPHRAGLSQRPQLLFTGTSAPRNMTALSGFVQRVLPKIERRMPEVQLLVGGAFGPSAQLQFHEHHNVRFTGRVDDMRPWFDQSHVYVAPFDDAHGSKLKIAEAMAMGMPIVSTPAGIRGFPLVHGESVLIARGSTEFADCCLELLCDRVRSEDLGIAARELALTSIDWAVLGGRLSSIVRSAFASDKTNF